jgi:hypothetical protein
MYVEIIPPDRGARTESPPVESAFHAHLASSHFDTWLKGQVLSSLEDRIRLDLVPLED